jgi:hypothetical protein
MMILSGCQTASAEAPPPQTVARFSFHRVSTKIITGNTTYILHFSLAPGDGLAVDLTFGPPIGCEGESEAFWTRYRELASTIPPLRVRHHPRQNRYEGVNREAFERARAASAGAATALLRDCDHVEEEDLQSARMRLAADLGQSMDLGTGDWPARLDFLFLAIRESNRLAAFTNRTRNGNCRRLLGVRLAESRFSEFTRCSIAVRPPGEMDDPGTLGTVIVAAGTLEGPPSVQYVTTFSKPPDENVPEP